MSNYTAQQTQIGGIDCLLEIEDDVSHCYLEHGTYSGTLEFLRAYGVLENPQGQQLAVSKSVLSEIQTWALDNGY